MPFNVLVQRDFSGGAFANPARELIPENGAASIVNGLLEEDGTVFRRGGSLYQSGADFGATLRFVWDGFLTAGARTVFATSADFGVLDSDDSTTINLGGSGTTGYRPAAGVGLLFVPVGTTDIAAYGGSRKTASYSTGTITSSTSSKTVTGVGSSWTANVDAGMILVSGSTYLGVVASVDSNTQVTLRDNAKSAVAAAAYSLSPVYEFTPTGTGTVDAIATASNPARLFVAKDSKVRFSPTGNPFDFTDSTNEYQLPQGIKVLGAETIRNVLFLFTTGGIFTVTGTDFDLTDDFGNVQHRVEQINRDVVLLDQRGIAGWKGALVVPALDDVYLMSESSAPESISGPIRTAYRDYVRQGYTAGYATVYRNHYFLPIVNGTTWVDTLVCRLDQGGWVTWDGHGGTSLGFATRPQSAGRVTKLLSINAQRVVDLSGGFAPSQDNAQDADGTDHVFELVTRDYTTDGLRKALVKKFRLRYELNAAGADNPQITLAYATGQVTSGTPEWGMTTWGSFVWGTSSEEQFSSILDEMGGAPETAVSPYTWPVITTESGVRPQFARFRLRQSGPCCGLKIRSIELMVRPGGRQ